MPQPIDFKVTGRGTALANDDNPHQIMFEGALEAGIKKACQGDTILTGGFVLDTDKLAIKYGSLSEDNPFGIFGRRNEYVYGIKLIKDGIVDGTGATKELYQEHQFTILAGNLQSILIDEGVLILPDVEEEAMPTIIPSPPLDDVAPDGPETHFVDAKSGFLKIRTNPTIQSLIIGEMPTGLKVRVVDEYLGQQCLWSKIEITGPATNSAEQGIIDEFANRKEPIYSHSSYFTPLPGIPESLPHSCDFTIDNDLPVPDWRNLEPGGLCCYYDGKTGEYQTVVATSYQAESDFPAGLTFEQLRRNILRVGVEKLLDYYGKVSSPDQVETILGAFRGPYIPSGAEGFYLNIRPGSYMKFMVAFPAKYFNAILFRDVDLEELLTPDDLTATFCSKTFREDIQTVATQLDQIALEIEAADVNVLMYNATTEAKRLLELPASFAQLLAINGYYSPWTKDWCAEVVLTKDFKVKGVFINPNEDNSWGKEGEAFPLNIGLVNGPTDPSGLYGQMHPDGFGFAKSHPVKRTRTMASLWYLEKMARASKTNSLPISGERAHPVAIGSIPKPPDLTWTGFVSAFTVPAPKIVPAKKKPRKKWPTPPGGRSSSELKKHLKALNDPIATLEAANAVKNCQNYVGSSIFTEADHLLARGGCSLQALYDDILNKFGIDGLLRLIKECFGFGGISAQLSCLETAVPGLAVAANAAVMEMELGGTSFSSAERKLTIIKFIYQADPVAAFECLRQPDLWLWEVPELGFPYIKFQNPFDFLLEQVIDLLIQLVAQFLCDLIHGLLLELACVTGAPDELSKDVSLPPNIADDVARDLDMTIDSSNYIASVMRGLTPGEVADLLDGTPGRPAREFVETVRVERPQFDSDLGDVDVIDYWEEVGNKLPPDFIISIREGVLVPDEPSLNPLLCDESGLRAGYSDGLAKRLPYELVIEQVKGQETRDEILRQKLVRLSVDSKNALPPKLREYEKGNLIPGFPGIDGESPGCIVGLLPPVIPVLDMVMKDSMDSIFGTVMSAFNEEASGFFQDMIHNRTRAIRPSDPGYLTYEEGDEQFDWNEARVDRENSQRSMSSQSVAPFLKKGLQLSRNIKGVKTTINNKENLQVIFKSDILERIMPPTASSAVTNAEDRLNKLEKELREVQMQHQQLKDEREGNYVNPAMRDREAELMGPRSMPVYAPEGVPPPTGIISGYVLNENSIEEARKVLKDERKKMAAGVPSTSSGTSPQPVQPTPEVLWLNIPYSVPGAPLKDEFKLWLLTPAAANHNIAIPNLLMGSLDKTVVPVPADMSIDGRGGNTAQAIAFADLVMSKITSHPEVVEKNSSALRTKLLDAHGKIYMDFLRKTGRQVAKSDLFELDNLLSINLAAPNQGGSLTSICAPGSEQDLLDVRNVVLEALSDYEDSCVTLVVPEGETTVFEEVTKAGAVKLATRVFMLETLLKAIFALAEFKTESLLSDPLFIEYIISRFEKDFSRYSRGFYMQVAFEANKTIEKRIAANFPLPNLFNAIDMDVLKGGGPSAWREALKYLALEQLPDLTAKLDEKIGTKTPNIHRRFTDPPENRGAEPAINPYGAPNHLLAESTEEGAPVFMPKEKGGWIRTIDVATALDGGVHDNRFQRTRQTENTLEQDWEPERLQTHVVDIKYPDLARPGGTFFIEKYIRIHDMPDQPPDIANRAPALRGIVNIKDWKAFVAGLPEDLQSEKITKYFSRWAYGLRLVWVPTMNPEETAKVVSEHTYTDTVKENIPLSAWDHVPYNGWDPDVLSGQTVTTQTGNPTEPFTLKESEWTSALDSAYTGIEVPSLKEKAFSLTENILVTTKTETDTSVNAVFEIDAVTQIYPGFTYTTTQTMRDHYRKHVQLFPLVSVESDGSEEHPFMGNVNSKLSLASSISEESDLNLSNRKLSRLRNKLIESEEYKFLFEYVFPLPRMISLITLYCGSALALTQPKTKNAFWGTKDALRALFWAMTPKKNQKWWSEKPPSVKAHGGTLGILKEARDCTGLEPSLPTLRLLAGWTIPSIIRGIALMTDPHYALVNTLVDAGWSTPGGPHKNWSKVPALWPVNFFFGWGPPLGLVGMLAYSMPTLPGDRNECPDDVATGKKAKRLEMAFDLDMADDFEDCDDGGFGPPPDLGETT